MKHDEIINEYGDDYEFVEDPLDLSIETILCNAINDDIWFEHNDTPINEIVTITQRKSK